MPKTSTTPTARIIVMMGKACTNQCLGHRLLHEPYYTLVIRCTSECKQLPAPAYSLSLSLSLYSSYIYILAKKLQNVNTFTRANAIAFSHAYTSIRCTYACYNNTYNGNIDTPAVHIHSFDGVVILHHEKEQPQDQIIDFWNPAMCVHISCPLCFRSS